MGNIFIKSLKRVPHWVFILFLAAMAVSVVYPFLWIALLSFKDNSAIYGGDILGLPSVWRLDNYSKAVTSYPIIRYFFNSLLYTLSTTIASIFMGSTFGYAISRMRFSANKGLRFYSTLGLIIPVEVIVLPIFMIEKSLGFLNTYQSLILPYTAFNLSVTILMFYAFYRSIPIEIEESACIEGASLITAFFKIIFPMVSSAISTLVIWLFVTIWNEFFLAYIFIRKSELKTLPLGVLHFMTSTSVDWGAMSASLMVTSIPLVAVYLFFSERVEKALTAGALLK